jgi:hypothetical protein
MRVAAEPAIAGPVPAVAGNTHAAAGKAVANVVAGSALPAGNLMCLAHRIAVGEVRNNPVTPVAHPED